jgi:hypothetical protein
MNQPSIQTITFLFDNKTDHILLHQIASDGPSKRKYSGIIGEPDLIEDHKSAVIRVIREAAGLDIEQAVLRGVVKAVDEIDQSVIIYFVYESGRFSGELENRLPGKLKWVDILNIFNLEIEVITRELMPWLLDGESFFDGTIFLDSQKEILSSDIRICNSI